MRHSPTERRGVRKSFRQRMQHGRKLSAEGIDMLSRDGPYQVEIDSEILMNHHVAKSNDLSPRDVRVSTSELFGQPPAGLTE